MLEATTEQVLSGAWQMGSLPSLSSTGVNLIGNPREKRAGEEEVMGPKTKRTFTKLLISCVQIALCNGSCHCDLTDSALAPF
jgi:hypothetical protein